MVTGCATGIGQGIAIGLAKAGAHVIALDIGDLEDTREQVMAAGGGCDCYQVDLSDSGAVYRVWEKLVAEAGAVDILFNNAGMQYRRTAFEYPEEMFDKVVAVNLKAAYLLSQRAAVHFRERGIRGKIINTASLFTTLGGRGICVNAIAPGYIQTELTRAVWSDPLKRKPIDERIPAGRWGRPEDFEGVAVFLASRASDYITGVMIPVDGGYSVR